MPFDQSFVDSASGIASKPLSLYARPTLDKNSDGLRVVLKIYRFAK